MYLLDTSVVSELRKPSSRINPGVAQWAKTVAEQECFLSVVTIFELERGVQLVERRDPSRGKVLRTWLDDAVFGNYKDRILEFDRHVAEQAAVLQIPHPAPVADSFIAATANHFGLTLVTRNKKDFERLARRMLNPFSSKE